MCDSTARPRLVVRYGFPRVHSQSHVASRWTHHLNRSPDSRGAGRAPGGSRAQRSHCCSCLSPCADADPRLVADRADRRWIDGRGVVRTASSRHLPGVRVSFSLRSGVSPGPGSCRVPQLREPRQPGRCDADRSGSACLHRPVGQTGAPARHLAGGGLSRAVRFGRVDRQADRRDRARTRGNPGRRRLPERTHPAEEPGPAP